MTRAAFAPLKGAEFGPFLFASVGDDKNGNALSVLSAIARTDVDPWEEAAYLERMQREKATVRLTAFIAAIPDRPAADIPARAIADRLLTLLPKKPYAPQASDELSKILAGSDRGFGLSFSAITLVIVLALVAFSLPRGENQREAKPVASAANSAMPLLPLGQ